MSDNEPWGKLPAATIDDSWESRRQPACGNPDPHLPHNGFATTNPDPWCHGVQDLPRGVSLDDRLKEAFMVGVKEGRKGDLYCCGVRDHERAFEEWKRTLLP